MSVCNSRIEIRLRSRLIAAPILFDNLGLATIGEITRIETEACSNGGPVELIF